VRELEAVLERALIFRSGDRITPEDLDLPRPRGGDVTESATAVERHGVPAAKAVLSWLQHEALRIVSERREVRARGADATGVAATHRVRRGARYVPLSWWFTMMSDAAEWAMALV
jgi:hypothetical protein